MLLIDDNESRVVQKELNYNIPKFNADYFWDVYSNSKKGADLYNEKLIFDSVLDFAYSVLKSCTGKGMSKCFSNKIGSVDQNNDEYYKWMKTILPRIKINRKSIEANHLFHQDFSYLFKTDVNENFPKFVDGNFSW